MRPVANAFSGFSNAPRNPWGALSRERDADGETKNYSVPPELIELARANRKARGQAGTLTPLAPKPAQDVVVVVPAPAPLARDIAPAASSQPESPAEGAPATQPVPMSPLAEMMRAELAAAAGEHQPNEESASVPSSSAQSSSTQPSSARPSSPQPSSTQPSSSPRRSSRRARRSLRVEIPVEATVAARAAAAAETPRLHSYLAYATGVVVVGGYITLCYYANALLSGVP
jgi:hypothetical protein